MSLISIALAQATCTVNGQEVPCPEISGLFAGLGIGIIILFAAVSLLSLVIWLVNLIHAIRYPVDSKAVWIIIMLIFGVLGAVIYYFAVKRPYDSGAKMVQPPTPPPAPPVPPQPPQLPQ